jgi:hypothetical protein
MAKRAENEGIRVLDDFICDAIPASGIPQADPSQRGTNDTGPVVSELIFDLGGANKDGSKSASTEHRPPKEPFTEDGPEPGPQVKE